MRQASGRDRLAPGAPALGFTSLDNEIADAYLEISGELPAWLQGSLLRTGPAKWEVGNRRMNHWFDGLAMLHRFTVGGGKVAYSNRFLESRSYRRARHGTIAYSEFATDPCRSLFKRVQAMFVPHAGAPDNGNINVARLDDRFIAMTETPLPVEFDPVTLEAAAVRPYRVPGHLSTAHPHTNRRSGGMINYVAKLGPRSRYAFYEFERRSFKPRRMVSLPVGEPAYMHSFGQTERWLVLAEFPFVVNPLRLAFANRPYIENYRWKPENGLKFTLIDRANGGEVVRFETDPCFAFHHVNAFEAEGEVVADVIAYPDPRLVEDLYLDRLRAGKPISRAQLLRFRLGLSRGTVTSEQLSDASLELPQINYRRCHERPYRYVWATDVGDGGWIEKVVKVDTESGAAAYWSEPGCYPGEPVFVPEPDSEDEDDGILLSLVLDADEETTFLVVLDARDLGEIARARVPHPIPFGFHGTFTSEPLS